MRILIIGATGLLGKAITEELKGKHEIIRAARNNVDIKVDITNPESIKEMYEKTGKIDAVISATGNAHFGPLENMTPKLNDITIENKLKGQINLILLGLNYVNDGGSITLTTGVIMDDPIYQGASSAMANGAIKAFVKSAAYEAPRRIRINSISPTVFKESSEELQKFFPGFEPVALNRVALTYKKSVEGIQTGQSYEIY